MTKDFMKLILKNEQKLLTLAEVKEVNVNKYDEISVKKIYDKMLQRKELQPYFPDTYPKGRQCDKKYFQNICATKFPDEVAELIKHANDQRFTKTGDEEDHETIVVNNDWMEKLQAHPF